MDSYSPLEQFLYDTGIAMPGDVRRRAHQIETSDWLAAHDAEIRMSGDRPSRQRPACCWTCGRHVASEVDGGEGQSDWEPSDEQVEAAARTMFTFWQSSMGGPDWYSPYNEERKNAHREEARAALRAAGGVR